MRWIFVLMAVFWAGSILMTLLGSLLSVWFLKAKQNSPVFKGYAGNGISILKPVKGMDAGTEKNLESFFHLDYPEFELLFSVADQSDPVVPLISRLIAKYPDVSAHLIVESVYIGPNPKVNNLVIGYGSAQFDSILISDSNIRVSPDYLNEMTCEFAGYDILCSVVAGTQAENVVGRLEEIFLNSFYIRPMVISNWFDHPCMMGKSLMFSKAKMEAVGGLKSLSIYLAEDFMAGEKFREAGFKANVSRFPVEQYIGKPALRAVWSRHIRWGRIRKNHAPFVFLLEPFGANAIISGIVGALAFSHFYPVSFLQFFAGHLFVWFLCDLATMRRLSQKMSAALPLLWLMRELAHLPLWVHIASSNAIQWKGSNWKIRRDGTLTDRPWP